MVSNKSPLFRVGALAAIAATVTISGCSVMGSRESPVNEATKGSPTVVEIYRGQANRDYGGLREQRVPTVRERLQESSGRGVREGDEVTNRYWSALEPMQQRFTRVPNPDLVMVVYPHLAQGKYPVPGYLTMFPMYEQSLYAKPGEVAEDRHLGHQVVQPPAKATATRWNAGNAYPLPGDAQTGRSN